MKKIMFIIGLFIVFYSDLVFSQKHFDKEIGINENEVAVITCDKDSLIKELENFVFKNAKIEAKYHTITIKKEKDSTVVYYFLLAEDSIRNIKTARELTLIGNVFFEAMSQEGGSTTVTCSGCNIGCNPYKLNGNWVCYPGCQPEKCEKSVTIVIPDDE